MRKKNFLFQELKKRCGKNILLYRESNGLYIYDGKKLRHIIIDEKNILSDNNRILDIAIYNHNSVWLLTPNGIVICDAKSGSLKQYRCTLSSCGQLKCLVKVDDTLYIGTEKGNIITFNLLHLNFAPYWNEIKVPISNLTYEKDVLGVATSGQGICCINVKYGVEHETIWV
jgi:hypothetical protein